jgi:hypothetical protein
MNFSSNLYFLVSTRALYYHVNRNYFYTVFLSFMIYIGLTQSLLIGCAVSLIALIIGSYISRGNPDFFDVYIESIRFSGFNRLHPSTYLSLLKSKTNGVRKWEA